PPRCTAARSAPWSAARSNRRAVSCSYGAAKWPGELSLSRARCAGGCPQFHPPPASASRSKMAAMLESRLLLLSAALLWSTAGAAMKLCQLSGVQIACGRSLIAGLFLFVAVPEARRRPTRAVFLTALAYAATVGLFAVSNKLTTAANAIFLQSTAPLWVLLLSGKLLGEPPTRAELFAVPIYGIGLSLFFLDELSPGQLTGNLVAVAAGVAFATCIIGFRRMASLPHAGSSASALVLGNGLAALVALPLWFQGPAARPGDLLILLYLGIFQL